VSAGTTEVGKLEKVPDDSLAVYSGVTSKSGFGYVTWNNQYIIIK
jgi:hypothetical protein